MRHNTVWRRLARLLVLLAYALGCRSESADPTGGETHFLTRCDADPKSCGTELQCLCGVCTLPCATRATCQALPAAQCVLASQTDGCTDSASPGLCEVSCVIDADCVIVSPTHRCDRGVCREGSVDTGAAGGTSGAPADGADAGTSACVRGSVPANQVLVIGDSFFASSHQITAYLEAQARSAGAVSAGERYRDRSSLLANSLAFGGTGIADQYASGIAEAEVRVVIMDGGGADALLGSCDTADASCPTVTAAAAAAQDLLAKMAADGVQHVVYVFYPDPGDPNVRARVDALRPLLQSACEGAAVPCHWLDLRAVFAGHYAEYIQADQLNPTDAGSRASAQAIWDVMTQSCIAQ